MNPRSSVIDWLLFLALGFMWGSSYLFIKIGVATFEPFTLIALRLGIGLTLLVAVVALARESLPRSPRMYGHLLFMAVFNIAVPFFLITWAEQSVESALAAILNATVPLFAIVIASLVLPDEPITLNRVVGLVIGFAGVVVVTSRGLSGAGGDLMAELALVGSAVSYAVGAVYARRNVRGLRPMIPALFQVGFAFLITATLAVLLEDPFGVTLVTVPVGGLELLGNPVFAVIWLGVLGSGLAYLAFFRTLQNWGATRTSMVAYLLPIVGITLGAIVLHEAIDARVVLGTGLVLGGAALVNSNRGSRRLFGRNPERAAGPS
ncbi:MAG TPA: DMT family transporter [Candidatus Limnocylindrales bacterium]|jgi:drug/metabolite transporter (DMT)-like permease